MTPEPTVIEPAVADGPDGLANATSSVTDKAAAIGFGGASSADTDHSNADNGSLLLLVGFVGVILAIGFLRSWWFPGILAGLLFILFMHELGHYVTARASGMKVSEFFLGFGPKIWSFTKGETEYGVKAIPAGAYVRILGMTNLEDVDPAEEHRTYRAQPYWQRMMTICAGSAMHFIMAIVALVVLFAAFSYQGFNGPPWFVDAVVEGSTASSLGIEPGDEILSVNDERFANWDEFGEVIGALEEGPVEIEINRDGTRQVLEGELGLRPEDVLFDGFGMIMLNEVAGPAWEVSFLWPGESADQIGLEVGDVVERAGDVDFPTRDTFALALRAADGGTLEVDVIRDGEPLSLRGELELKTSPPFRGFFGVGPTWVPQEAPGVGGSTTGAFRDFGTISRANLVGIGDMVAGVFEGDEAGFDRRAEVLRAAEIQERQAARAAELAESGVAEQDSCNGPDTNRPLSVIGIGRVISCSESADQVLFLLAMVNIFIGIFNLLPLLPLDGGHAAIATYERIRGLVTGKAHRVDATKLIPVTWLVIVLLLVLGVWTATLDIFSWSG